MKELKQCPFCGGEAAVIKSTFIGYGEDYYQPVCLDCNASKAGFRYRTREDAINAWNRRASDKYRWHDLRANPNDVPHHENPVLVTYGDEDYDILEYWDCDGWGAAEAVIAWRAIEPFEEEET